MTTEGTGMGSPEWRAQVSSMAVGKVVKSLHWVPEEGYWVMTFTDGSEISVQLMVEIAVEAG